MGRRTPLYELHQSSGARIIDFGGWDMPLHYGSQIEEHHAVRRGAGVFDVSHMCAVDVSGAGARPLLRRLLANDVDKLKSPGKALYGCMLNDTGGIVDDLIAYFVDDHSFRVVVNAGTRERDLVWFREHARAFAADIHERADLALLAVQGPTARAQVAELLEAAAARAALALAPFTSAQIGGWFIARTGYTGEDGFEIMMPAADAVPTWRELTARGVVACGLGARDTLRLEAGMNLYGSDMDESTHPLESNLGWTVAFEPGDRQFVGRDALERVRACGSARKLVGLVLLERGVLRAHQTVIVPGVETGTITSGTFSPTLQCSIALARLPSTAPERVEVDIRGKLLNARVVRPPFVRNGRSLITQEESR
jgi:aminomethyltransferase